MGKIEEFEDLEIWQKARDFQVRPIFQSLKPETQMINKRLLVKNLLAHNDENSFYDKKRFIDIGQKEGKGKFLKHVCALANSNPKKTIHIS